MIKPKKTIALYMLGTMMMVFFAITGSLLNKRGNIEWTMNETVTIIAASLLLGAVIGAFLAIGIGYLDIAIKSINNKSKDTPVNFKSVFKRPSFVGIVAFIIIAICYIPGYLAYYPGILSYDSGIQIGQYLSKAYNEHHPLIHTLIIEGFLRLGEGIFGSFNAGVAAYCLIQLILFALVFAFGIAVCFRIISKKNFLWAYIWSGILCLYCGLFDFNRFMAITVTKDSLFAIFFLLQLILFVSMINTKPKKTKAIIFEIAYSLALILCVLFRNNAKYALIVLMLAEIIVAIVKWISYLKKKDGERPYFYTILPMVTLVSLVIAGMILLFTSKLLGATQGDRREMLSIPIQQMARTAVYHSGQMIVYEDDGSLSEENMAVVNEFLLDGSYALYEQDIADPVKRHTNTYEVRYRTKEFMTAYLDMLKEHFGDYINAFVAVENGFLNINDTSHAYVNQKEAKEGLGYVQTRWDEYLYSVGFYKDSKLTGLYNALESWCSNNTYLKYPLLRHIYMPGIYLYVCLFTFICLLDSDKKKLLYEAGFILLYFGTCLLGPTVQMRYVYPFMIVCPFMIIMFIASKGYKNS